MGGKLMASCMASADHAVGQFRQILWLPLQCSDSFGAAVLSPEWRAHWSPLKTGLLEAIGRDALRPHEGMPGETHPARDETYSAQLYFHPFVRRFLFSQSESEEAALKVYELSHPARLCTLDVTLPEGQKPDLGRAYTLRFRIARCLLYHFVAPRVVMLEVELAWQDSAHAAHDAHQDGRLNLAEVMDCLDFLRRTHPAYFPPDTEAEGSHPLRLVGGRYPIACTLSDGLAALGPPGTPDQTALRRRKEDVFLAHLARAQGNAADPSPLFEPWRSLLGPAAQHCWQIEDERMPYAAFIAVDSPHSITPGDWIRLAYADYRGDSETLPYSRACLDGFENACCYDRFFDPAQPAYANTRYLNTGYAFTALGSSRSGFFIGTGLQTFRHQYALMGLLAQFSKACLLAFSDRLAAAGHHRSSDPGRYRHELRTVLSELTEFTHRHWFEGVTNQLQGSELYELWANRLGLKPLYGTVLAEARGAYDYLAAEEAHAAAVYQQQQANRLENLSKAAFWLAAAGIALALMGAGFPFDKPLSLFLPDKADQTCSLMRSDCLVIWPRLAVLGITAVVLVKLLMHLWVLLNGTQPRDKQQGDGE